MSSHHASDSSQAFVYLPITEPDGIRLADVQPDIDPGTPIHCSLIYTTLSECGREVSNHYAALSYVWGDSTNPRTVWIDDEFEVQITTNLFLALRGLRDQKSVLGLWADALCIDQQNNAEKSLQVPMMGKIYATASDTSSIYRKPLQHKIWP